MKANWFFTIAFHTICQVLYPEREKTNQKLLVLKLLFFVDYFFKMEKFCMAFIKVNFYRLEFWNVETLFYGTVF